MAVWLAMAVATSGALLGGGGCKPGEKPSDKPATEHPAAPPDAATGGMDIEQARFDEERRPDVIVAALGIGPGSRVADVGAGSGLLTVHLARAVLPNGKVVGQPVGRQQAQRRGRAPRRRG
jgi:predicted methyltransferase